MKAVMIGDRLHNRAEKAEFYVFDEMTRGCGNDENRSRRTEIFCEEVKNIAREIEK